MGELPESPQTSAWVSGDNQGENAFSSRLSRYTWVTCRFLGPRPDKDYEGDIVRDKQARNPERRNPIGGAHKWRSVIDGRQRNGRQQVKGTLDVEQPNQHSCDASLRGNRGNREQRQHRGQQIAECCGIGKLRRDAGVSCPRCKEHQT